MALKQGLQLKLGQSLTMTPQLQQAIKLLQLSALDLQQEVYEVLESNPMLELEDEFDSGASDSAPDSAADSASTAADAKDANGTNDSEQVANGEQDAAPTATEAELAGSGETETTAQDNEQMPDDLPVDTSWEDVYDGGFESAPGQSSSGASGDSDLDFTEFNSAPLSLQDSLSWQLSLTHLSERDRTIGAMIVDSINADGMLTASLEDLVAALNRNAIRDSASSDGELPPDSFELDEVTAVLKLVQQFEPTGVGARDLGECLRLQLDALPEDVPYRGVARALVCDHLDSLGARDFTALKRRCKLDDETLTEAIRLIQSLNPRPGSTVSEVEAEYIVPDVLVKRLKGRWTVELNPETTPKLRINDTYASLIRRADSSRDNTFLKDNLQEARWFMKSLQSRHETLLKVASKIVEHQRGFFEYGPEAMKPLVLHDIATAVDMHESTISRVTSRKYMHTPRGIFELKYFFSSHVGTTSGGEVSSTAIRALIQKLTADEDPKKPLSDSKLAALLKEQNINVARRTVAKYRESMGIPPSNERKRLI
ncbi:MAG: RNA polymerase factor sigma-54 [Pseudomonadota bacterium]